MKLLCEISLLLLRNTALVLLAVVLGFALGSALGVPAYLQGFCLLPAALLFHRLSAGGPFAWRTVLLYLALLSGLGFALSIALPLVPAGDRGLLIVLLVTFVPVPSMMKWLDRRSRSPRAAPQPQPAPSDSKTLE
ncbi:hypothetical protein [Prosthecobacter sp.]|uniref:hypothetical protein n=1 Tax=Prosthecobacter sp. TaxID=1965333 RepID=UPI00378471C0